jgi:predicted alpha/beta hydrolase family esterase
LPRAQQFAAAWGSRLVNIGNAGHINTASGFGDWPAGLELLHQFESSMLSKK